VFPCAYKNLFGIDCPACGTQRSLALLVRGDLAESFHMYPPLIPVLLIITGWLFYLVYPGRIKTGVLKKLTGGVLFMVMVNYLLHLVM